MTFSGKLIGGARAVLALAAVTGAAGAGFAQQAPTTAPKATLEEVIVTGSQIRRVDAETPSPVQVVTADDLKQSGFTTVAEVLQNLTANGQGTLSNAFPGAFAGSATGVSLRGLNTSATLVMIDGHRMAPFPLSDDGQRSFVDISSIPFDAVERIEVLKDGASAAYGSDAMAGVVNIILKKRFVGATASAEGGSTTEGGGTTAHATAAYGIGDLASDGYNAYINLEYRNQGAITQKSRQGDGLWSSLDMTSIGGITQVPGVPSSRIATPRAYGTVYLTSTTDPYSAASSLFYASPIQPNPAYKGTCTYALQQTGGCAFVNPRAEVQPKTQNVNVIASVEKKLGSAWLLDVKASLFDSKGDQCCVGSYGNGLVGFPQSFTPLVAVSAGVLPHIVGTTIPAITVPATYPGNTTGAAAFVNGIDLDAPNGITEFASKSYRFVADLSGAAAGWDLDAAAGYTRVETTEDLYGAANIPVLNALLNQPVNPYLITGGNTAANIAAVYPTASATDTSVLEFLDLNATRTLATLEGGNLGISIGAQYIHRDLHAPAPTLVAQGIISGNNAYVEGSQSDTAAFMEVAIPVLKALEIDGHWRFDHFDNGENSSTPSIGAKFRPVEQFAIRGTYGRGFRAPNPAENGKAGQGYSAGTSSDPVLCPGGGAAAGDVISQCNFDQLNLNTSNPTLRPETSTSETVGLILEPIKGWSSTLDFYQVNITNQIVAGQPDASMAVRGAPVADTCVGPGGVGTVPCTPPVGPIIYVPAQYINANSTKVNGIELSSRYTFNLADWGKLTAELDWSHMMSYLLTIGGVSAQLAGTHGPAVIGGNTGNPKDRAQLSLSFDRGPLEVRTIFNYVGKFSLTDPSGSYAGFPVLTCADAVQTGGYVAAWFTASVGTGVPTNPKYCKIPDFFTADLTARYSINDHWTVHGAVTNLFNQQPPVDLNTYGGGNLPYNPSMHQIGAVGRFINLGVVVKFQ